MNSISRILASLALAILLAVELNSCQKAGTTETTATPASSVINEVDVLINDYEKLTNQYLRLSNKIKGGDVSVTVRYMDLTQQLREWPAKHQEIYAKMAPQQAQRVAGISARTAPYLNP